MGAVGKPQPTLTDLIFIDAAKTSWTHGDLEAALRVGSIRLIVKSFMNPRQFIALDLVNVSLGEKSLATFLRDPNRVCL